MSYSLLLTILILLGVSKAERIRCPKKYANEREFMESLADDYTDSLPECPSTHIPYNMRFCHKKPFRLQFYPNTNRQDPRIATFGSVFFRDIPFVALKHNLKTGEKDSLKITIKQKFQPLYVRRICMKTFAVIKAHFKFIDRSEKMIDQTQITTQQGSLWFRSICTDKMVDDLKYIDVTFETQNPTFNIRDLVIMACIPKNKQTLA